MKEFLIQKTDSQTSPQELQILLKHRQTIVQEIIAGQLIRCGLAPALLYGEAQSAESRDDFIHKMKIVLKELKETRVCLRLIKKREMIKPLSKLENVTKENEELIAIISKSIDTAKRNNKKEK